MQNTCIVIVFYLIFVSTKRDNKMEYTAKQIENAKSNYNAMLVIRTVESYEPQYIGWAAAEQRCEFHNKIVTEILAGNVEAVGDVPLQRTTF